MKKLLSLFLAAMMIASIACVFSVGVFADDKLSARGYSVPDNETENGWEHEYLYVVFSKDVKAPGEDVKIAVVVFAGGTGCPFFSTDTAAVLKACEIGADTVLMAKNIDAIYTASPSADPNAKKLSETTYSYILDHKLGVIDLTAAALALENKMPLHVFGLKDTENISRVLLSDEKTGTVVAAE